MPDKLELPFSKAILNAAGFALVVCFKLRGLQLLPPSCAGESNAAMGRAAPAAAPRKLSQAFCPASKLAPASTTLQSLCLGQQNLCIQLEPEAPFFFQFHNTYSLATQQSLGTRLCPDEDLKESQANNKQPSSFCQDEAKMNHSMSQIRKSLCQCVGLHHQC